MAEKPKRPKRPDQPQPKQHGKGSKKDDGPTALQKLFVERLFANRFAVKQSAIEAGYSPKNAASQGGVLLTKPAVQAYFQERWSQIANQTDVEVAQIIDELKLIAFSSVGNYLTFGPDGVMLKPSTEIDPTSLRAIAQVSESLGPQGAAVKLKVHDKLAALKMLGEYKRMWKPLKSIDDDDGDGGRRIVIDLSGITE